MTFNSSQDPQPAVEYRAVCRGLPTDAHWTDGSTRKEIPQTESSPNVWTPSPVGTYSTSTKDTECHFVCDGGFEWDSGNKTCDKSSKWMCDMNAVCGANDIRIGSYTIKACNLGTSIAGT
ncbi:MAG: hypothetical protein LBG59_03420 [Candidatus Peribacteria bacterium]|jgi:hypothetical protein|nr:hypothetical protein [Candidatus Peribacteria bacterium]